MQTSDLERTVEGARRGAPIRAALRSLWRRRQEPGETAAACLKAGQDPERRLEPLRRQPQ
ncbi:hypothetical protein [Falsiroseomonas selenitidurans]|uniref:Uncharacterized protein n=1 Tax=Falsiroseomonas selenitidurans TaxID=2716335 RepID=A0ABX1ECC7_9PROT|nr:hypothetical protein [Falsiroseomonas selenitidurans]NKC33537.1 hypothetical protein [Falsiroseomonas selenitidurans]